MKQRSECLYCRSLDIWGDKWSLLIIRDIMFQDKHTYGEFLNSKEKIATNILATRLVSLEENGIISKKAIQEGRCKYFYSLTMKGITLLPVMAEIILWASNYFPVPDELKPKIAALKSNKGETIKELADKLMTQLKNETQK